MIVGRIFPIADFCCCVLGIMVKSVSTPGLKQNEADISAGTGAYAANPFKYLTL